MGHWIQAGDSAWWRHQMETFFGVTGHLCGEFTGPRWIPRTKASQWRGALTFSLIWVWIKGWVNNREAGDLRRYRAHYDVIVMGAIRSGPQLLDRMIHCDQHSSLSYKVNLAVAKLLIIHTGVVASLRSIHYRDGTQRRKVQSLFTRGR